MRRRRTPVLILEKMALGEISKDERARIEEEDGVEAVNESILAIKKSNSEILHRYPPDQMARQIALRSKRRRPSIAFRSAAVDRGFRLSSTRLSVMASAAATVVVIVGLVALLPHITTGGSTGSNGAATGAAAPGGAPSAAASAGIRAKGAGPLLSIYRQNGSQAELLSDGASASANDVLQIRYNSEGRKFGMILSIDGNHTVTVHLPERSSEAAALSQGQTVTLPYAYRLDNAPGFERFYFIVSDSEFSTKAITARAQVVAEQGAAAVARLPLPAGFDQTSVLVKKPSRR